MTWSTLKAQIRRLLVDTDSTKYRWTELQLLDFIGWSLDALCSHTSIATATSFTCDGSTSLFTVPDNCYERVDKAGAVYLQTSTAINYLNPIRFNMRRTNDAGFYLTGDSTINIVPTAPLNADVLLLNYFAYYPHPSQDSDLILSPSWATPALCYRVAAHAFSPLGGKSANIRQWSEKPDTGNPEDNSLQKQSAWYFELWERELYLAPRQERENFWSNTS